MKKLFRINLRHLAANSAEATGNIRIAIGAANDRPVAGEEWEQVTPWGDFPNRHGLQRLTITQGKAMVAAFNSVASRLEHAFRGVPIFIGHPDVDPAHYKDSRRIGKVEGLEARTDGLYCKVAWNDLGKQNVQQGYYVYPSAVWKFKRAGGGVIHPFELVSIGLTNTPNIPGVSPWAKNDEAATGALADWAKRRAAGCSGANNPRAARAWAAMRAKKQGADPYDFQSGSTGSGHQVHIHIGTQGDVSSIKIHRRASNDGAKIAAEISAQKKLVTGYSAGTALLKKASEFQKQGDGERVALLKARKALPATSAIADQHHADLAAIRDSEESRNARSAFAKKVHERMDREKISYREAWLKEKNAASVTPTKT